MLHFLKGIPDRIGLANASPWLVLGIFVGSLLISFALMVLMAVELPADYFSPKRSHKAKGRWWERVGIKILKNAAGVLLVLVGIVLCLPGVPGPGVATVLVGLMLTDLPGVRWLARSLVRRESVRSPMNSLRKKFGKAPLRVE